MYVDVRTVNSIIAMYTISVSVTAIGAATR